MKKKKIFFGQLRIVTSCFGLLFSLDLTFAFLQCTQCWSRTPNVYITGFTACKKQICAQTDRQTAGVYLRARHEQVRHSHWPTDGSFTPETPHCFATHSFCTTDSKTQTRSLSLMGIAGQTGVSKIIHEPLVKNSLRETAWQMTWTQASHRRSTSQWSSLFWRHLFKERSIQQSFWQAELRFSAHLLQSSSILLKHTRWLFSHTYKRSILSNMNLVKTAHISWSSKGFKSSESSKNMNKCNNMID